MQPTTIRLHSLPLNSVRTYLTAALFAAGNIALPQLLHQIPQGGATWLPIYFFTLVGAYKYGWRTGLLTALASPAANAILFGMPAVAALPAIMLKSVLLALIAGMVANRTNKATIGTMAAVVLGYQSLGTIGEWLISGNLALACQDFRTGLPGIAFQIFGGWAVINYFSKRK
ncbi:MAG: ECF transporter S component [Paramuribaculum sp.]|nr:ECF transporter S component [Paramuribaculum sp.]MDE6322990.1 ECF transporter S component [Paramuribaculum sp.]